MTHPADALRDFLERAVDPRYGMQVNHDYSFRLGQLLRDDEDFVRLVERTLTEPSAVSALPDSVWSFLLMTTRAGPDDADQVAPLSELSVSEESLHRVYELASGSALRATAVRVATERDETVVSGVPHPFEFPNEWMRDRIERSLSPETGEPAAPPPAESEHTRGSGPTERDRSAELRMWALVIASLQAATPVSVQAAESLLSHRQWEGYPGLARALAERYASMLSAMGDEAQSAWQSWLDPEDLEDSI